MAIDKSRDIMMGAVLTRAGYLTISFIKFGTFRSAYNNVEASEKNSPAALCSKTQLRHGVGGVFSIPQDPVGQPISNMVNSLLEFSNEGYNKTKSI